MTAWSETRWNGTIIYRADANLSTAKIFVTPNPSYSDNYALQKTSDVAAANKLAICVNGGEFDYVETRGWPRGLVASRGKVRCNTRRLEQSIYFDAHNKISFLKKRNVWNAINFANRLVIGGVPCWHPLLTDITPRTFLGITFLGATLTTLSFNVIAGIDGWIGATIDQCAQLCAEAGYLTAVLLDGGYDSTFCIDGKLVNVPANDGIPGHEASIPTHIGVY